MPVRVRSMEGLGRTLCKSSIGLCPAPNNLNLGSMTIAGQNHAFERGVLEREHIVVSVLDECGRIVLWVD